MIDKTVLAKIRNENDIVSVIKEHIKLKTNGKEFLGECILNDEKASIVISPSSQTYLNLFTGTGGDVIDFISNYKEISLYDAVKELANRGNVELPELNITERESKKARIIEINKDAAKFFYKVLYSPKGMEGLKYFTDRNIDQSTIRNFVLGYAPKSWSSLTKYISSKGYTKDEMLASGLFGIDDNGNLRDKFVNRVMFPIINDKKEVVAFGGRVLDDSKPKYMNSPETLAYHKSDNLYGWNVINTNAKENLIICEGYMDVLAMQQAGFKQACASLGTAFTNEQAEILKRYTKNIYLAYDNDEAGKKAAIKNIQILRNHGLDAKVLDLNPYKDPDEFIKNRGEDEFKKRIINAKDGYIYLLSSFTPGSTEFMKLSADILIKEKEDRNLILDKISSTFNIPAESIKKEVGISAASVNKSDLLKGSLDDILARIKEIEDIEKKERKTTIEKDLCPAGRD